MTDGWQNEKAAVRRTKEIDGRSEARVGTVGNGFGASATSWGCKFRTDSDVGKLRTNENKQAVNQMADAEGRG